MLDGAFAIALPDSLGGLAILSHDPDDGDRSDLFILQVRSLATGTFQCGPVTTDSPCHGRLLLGLPVDGSGPPQSVLAICSGSLLLTEAGPDRVRGTLEAVLGPADDDDAGDTIVIENGTIDVPLVRDTLSNRAIACLRACTGGDPLPRSCR